MSDVVVDKVIGQSIKEKSRSEPFISCRPRIRLATQRLHAEALFRIPKLSSKDRASRAAAVMVGGISEDSYVYTVG